MTLLRLPQQKHQKKAHAFARCMTYQLKQRGRCSFLRSEAMVFSIIWCGLWYVLYLILVGGNMKRLSSQNGWSKKNVDYLVRPRHHRVYTYGEFLIKTQMKH